MHAQSAFVKRFGVSGAYGERALDLIECIRNREADVAMITAHKAKGDEFQDVTLGEDYRNIP